MVKLVTVRRARLYGPPSYREWFEMANAVVYLAAMVLLFVGAVFELPDLNSALGLTLVLVALVLLVAINLHDLHAQLAGIEFDVEILRLDTQLAFVEVAAPLVYALGSVLLFIGVVFLLRLSPGKHFFWVSRRRKTSVHSLRLLFSGALAWLVGSILNNFQVYAGTPLQLQAYQKSILTSFLVSSALLVFSTALGLDTWPSEVARQVQSIAVWFSVVACGLLVVAAVMNIIRIIQMRQYERSGVLLEPVRGGPLSTDDATSALINRQAVEGQAPTTTAMEPERLY